MDCCLFEVSLISIQLHALVFEENAMKEERLMNWLNVQQDSLYHYSFNLFSLNLNALFIIYFLKLSLLTIFHKYQLSSHVDVTQKTSLFLKCRNMLFHVTINPFPQLTMQLQILSNNSDNYFSFYYALGFEYLLQQYAPSFG